VKFRTEPRPDKPRPEPRPDKEVKGRIWSSWTPRGAVLGALSLVTLGVAVLSVFVAFHILHPVFGAWAVPTVAALDALWVVMQATEILAGNHRGRADRVKHAGYVLTAINAGIPTADLIVNSNQFSLAVVLTPIAIIATKAAWWRALPSLGRRVSAGTRQTLAEKRQSVADRLEEMEAEAAHRVELLTLATQLERQVSEAETDYRLSTLQAQQTMTEALHTQAEATTRTFAEKALPATVSQIALPELGKWQPVAPTLPAPVTPALPAGEEQDEAVTVPVTQANGLESDEDDAASHLPSHVARLYATVADLAAAVGVTTPMPYEPQLTDEQITVVLRALRSSEDPPMSYRKAIAQYRWAGYVGGESKIRPLYRQMAAEDDEGAETDRTDCEDAETEPAGERVSANK
jgi:hypothetical protein